MYTLLRPLIPALVLLASTAAVAAEFSVTPVRIFMTQRDRAVAVTIENEGNEDVVMQAELYEWKQKPDGQDDLKPTEDLVLSPPILKLAPKARQVVRLARIGPPPTSEQLTYRLIVREVPEARPPSPELKLQIALAFSLPVFITPPVAKRDLACSVSRTGAATASVTCENKGTAYAQPREFVLLGTGGERLAERDSGGYLLPQVKRGFELKVTGPALPAGQVRLQVSHDDGTVQNFDLALTD